MGAHHQRCCWEDASAATSWSCEREACDCDPCRGHRRPRRPRPKTSSRTWPSFLGRLQRGPMALP
eukprot:9338398-Alexandrium_andersonii.AAC.1